MLATQHPDLWLSPMFWGVWAEVQLHQEHLRQQASTGARPFQGLASEPVWPRRISSGMRLPAAAIYVDEQQETRQRAIGLVEV